jgi:AraC-like DNA-binding protein
VIHFDISVPFEAEKTLECFLERDGEIGAGVYFSEQTVDSSIRHAFEAIDSLQQFLSTAKEIDSNGKVLLRSIITQILLLLGVAHSEERIFPEENILSGVIGYINEHLEENLSLDELSRRFFVSKYHLCRAFRKYMGTTFLSYLTTKRVAMAQRLIEEGEAATEVAYRVGFRDYSSFYRAYRKQTGRAPAWERKQV